MGGSVNLQGGGQYSMPNIQGYGQNAANIGQSAAGFGSRFGNRFGDRGYGPPPQYDGGYGDFGDYGGVSTGGKGFQQQPAYQPAPVLSPFTTSPQLTYDTSTGGKGFQTRQTPAQSVAYAPMNIPQMQLAQPGFYYPNIGSQMANLNANYGMGGLGAMGAFGNYPMMQRQPAPMQMYPALAPPPPPPPTSTGGKGMRTKPPRTPPGGYGPPTQPGYPPVGTGGKGFQPSQPFEPPPHPMYPNEPDVPDYGKTGGDDVLRPVRPEDFRMGYQQPGKGSVPEPMPDEYLGMPRQDFYPTRGPIGQVADEYDRAPIMEPEYYVDPMRMVTPAQEVQPTDVETTMPTYEQDTVEPFMGLNQRDLID